MKQLARGGFVAGVVLLAFLGIRLGKASLLQALSGSLIPLACAAAYQLIPLVLYTQSWRTLLLAPYRPRFLKLLKLRWMGQSINALLPVAQVGGDLIRARRLVMAGVSAPDAGASLIADLTLGVLSQVVFTMGGLLALALHARGGPLAGPMAAGLAFLVVVALPLVVLLRFGVHRVASRLPWWRSLTTRWKGLAGGAARLDAALQAMLLRRQLIPAFFWHLAGWSSQVGETWLVLALTGHRTSWIQALMIESLAATARGAAFFVPGGLGVQEATVVGIGRYLGLPLEAAVGLGVIKRLRELVVGLPGLAGWAYTERGLARRPPVFASKNE
jgi:putative membrane protein